MVGGVLQAAPPDALGIDYNLDGKGTGFNPASLLGSFASPPFLHNGACETLACVVADVSSNCQRNATRRADRPRQAGLGGQVPGVDRRDDEAFHVTVGNANAVSPTYLDNVFSVCSAVECNRLNCVLRVWRHRESLSLQILPLPPGEC